jgi:hypothetical protein
VTMCTSALHGFPRDSCTAAVATRPTHNDNAERPRQLVIVTLLRARMCATSPAAATRNPRVWGWVRESVFGQNGRAVAERREWTPPAKQMRNGGCSKCLATSIQSVEKAWSSTPHSVIEHDELACICRSAWECDFPPCRHDCSLVRVKLRGSAASTSLPIRHSRFFHAQQAWGGCSGSAAWCSTLSRE